MKTEFGEVEAVPPGTVSSSTMPRGYQPKLCRDSHRAAAVRSLVPLALGSHDDRARSRPPPA
jgi:hypothetical protein